MVVLPSLLVQWVNLCLDLGSYVAGLFRGHTYKSLEGVSIGGSCLLRRIFTLHDLPADTVSGEGQGVEPIPKGYHMASGVVLHTQVL